MNRCRLAIAAVTFLALGAGELRAADNAAPPDAPPPAASTPQTAEPPSEPQSNAGTAKEAPSTAPAAPNVREACKADFEKFCGGEKPRGCLREHAAELDGACARALLAAGAARHAMREACKADIQKLCAAENGHVVKCLRQHGSEIQAACGDALEALRPMGKRGS